MTATKPLSTDVSNKKAKVKTNNKAKTTSNKAKAKATAADVGPLPRHLVFQDFKSHKFWIIDIVADDPTMTKATFGKVGTNGQSRTKSHDSAEKALKYVAKIIQQKLDKGYEEAPVEE